MFVVSVNKLHFCRCRHSKPRPEGGRQSERTVFHLAMTRLMGTQYRRLLLRIPQARCMWIWNLPACKSLNIYRCERLWLAGIMLAKECRMFKTEMSCGVPSSSPGLRRRRRLTPLPSRSAAVASEMEGVGPSCWLISSRPERRWINTRQSPRRKATLPSEEPQRTDSAISLHGAPDKRLS